MWIVAGSSCDHYDDSAKAAAAALDDVESAGELRFASNPK
jgi:hypothetical protein